MLNDLRNREVNGGQVTGSLDDGFRLTLPKISSGTYCLAQIDDYMHLARREFPHQLQIWVKLEAKISAGEVPGTWGFGLWNDPFSLGFGAGGMSRLMPVLPNAAWFFYGSRENSLSLRDDLPGSGFHVKTYRSPLLPSVISLLAVPGLPFVLWPAAARLLRRLAQVLVKEAAAPLETPDGEWHAYDLLWGKESVTFIRDGKEIFKTQVSPAGRLGLVIWIDNQYFKFGPDGKLGFGYLKTPAPSSLEIRNLSLEKMRV